MSDTLFMHSFLITMFQTHSWTTSDLQLAAKVGQKLLCI